MLLLRGNRVILTWVVLSQHIRVTDDDRQTDDRQHIMTVARHCNEITFGQKLSVTERTSHGYSSWPITIITKPTAPKLRYVETAEPPPGRSFPTPDGGPGRKSWVTAFLRLRPMGWLHGGDGLVVSSAKISSHFLPLSNTPSRAVGSFALRWYGASDWRG